MRVVTVARKPLSEENVGRNLVEHGCGALDTDGCRIGSGGTWGSRPKYRLTSKECPGGSFGNPESVTEVRIAGEVKLAHAGGRWPANLVLAHLGGCRIVGEEKIHAPGADNETKRTVRVGSKSSWGGTSPDFRRSHRAEDGTETVPSFACVPGCPVAELDAQAERNNAERETVSVRPSRYFRHVNLTTEDEPCG